VLILARFEGGNILVVFFEQLIGKWLHALDMRKGLKEFPSTCSGRSIYHMFLRRTRFGVMLALLL
jgi:hypothetical protein